MATRTSPCIWVIMRSSSLYSSASSIPALTVGASPSGGMRLKDAEASCDRPSLTFSAGGPIMSIEWCPYPPSPASKATDRPKAYLAIATLPSLDARPDMHSRLPHSTPGTVQLWSFVASQSVTGKDSGADGDVEMDGERRMEPEMRCEVMLCLDGGPVTQVSWMPLGAWEKVSRKLGGFRY